VQKVILPDDHLLDATHEDIDKYIQNLDKSWDPAHTVRISHIPKYGLAGDVLQMVIPKALLNSRGGGLDIKAECKDGHGGRGPTVDYGQWEDAKGAKLKRLSGMDKIQALPNMLKKANGLIDSARTLAHVDTIELLATNAMYTAREGAGEVAETLQECQAGGELKKLCKEAFKWHIDDRKSYAGFLVKASAKSLDLLAKSLDEKEDAAARAKAAKDLKEWAAKLQDKVEDAVKNLEAIKNKEPTALPIDSPKFLAVEKEALQGELGIMKKGLNKVANEAAAMEAKHNPESKTPVQPLKVWLAKVWAKVGLPSNGNKMEEDGQSPTVTNDPGTSETDDGKRRPPNPFRSPTTAKNDRPPPNPFRSSTTAKNDRPPPNPFRSSTTAKNDRPPPNPYRLRNTRVKSAGGETSGHPVPGIAISETKKAKGKTHA
jgi:hypothetical protein